MGNCFRLNAKLVLPHELRIGDHILIKHCCGDINAIFIDDVKSRCIYLDNITGYVTETYLQTLCIDTNKLFRYDYSATITMSPIQTVTNSRYFALRGKFSKCCLTSSYQFAYNCKVNKYISIDDQNALSSFDNQDSLLMAKTSDALTLCIDNHGIEVETLSTSNESDTNLNSAGANDGTQTAFDIKPTLAMHNALLQKLQSMDDEIKSIKNTQQSLLQHQDEDKDEEYLAHQSCSIVPLNSNVNTKKTGSTPNESPITMDTMDTSITLTPIRSQTGNPGGNTSVNYGKNLGVIVVPDINTSSSRAGGQFSVIGGDSSMSMSITKN